MNTCLSQMEQNNYYQEICKTISSLKEPPALKNECEKNRRVEEKESFQSKQISTSTFLQISRDDPDYCGWVPPEGQSGGCRTHVYDNMVVDCLRILKEDLVDLVAWGIGILCIKVNGQKRSSSFVKCGD